MNRQPPDPHGALSDPELDPTADLARVIDQSVAQLWQTVETLERLHPRNLERFRVSVFGSSRVAPGTELYTEAREIARRLTEAGCDLISGGGSGLMQAATEGATQGRLSRPASGDLPVRLVEGAAETSFVERVFRHRTFFSRLHHFVRLSSAYVVLPGGIGTVLEAMMVWQLLQVKHLPPTPFILFGDHWEGLLEWASDTVVDRGFADVADLRLPRLARTIDEVVELVAAEMDRFRGDDARP